jgi:D-3-phosphoglycerate dehydrogenase
VDGAAGPPHNAPVPKAHALLLENIHATAASELAQRDVSVSTRTGALEEDALIDALRATPGDEPILLGIRSKTHVTPAVFAAVPRLAAIGAFCIGTDQIALDVARGRGVAVFNAPFSSTRSVAELVLGEIIMLARQVFPRSAAAHAGKWLKSADGAVEVRGKTLGIVGYGHIGTQLSILAEALGMHVVFYDIVPKLTLGRAEAMPSLDALLETSDFVSLHVPSTESTHGMMTKARLSQMKRGAYLVNASRGSVVDIDALCELLASGHVAGAAIDVFPVEPAKVGDAFESPLRGQTQVILTPHIGGSTLEAQANIGREVAMSLVAWLGEGQTLGSVTLPELDAAARKPGMPRIMNVHRNVPGVLSATNRAIADLGLNIAGQRLATNDDVGVLHVDLGANVPTATALELVAAIAALPTSLQTRLV